MCARIRRMFRLDRRYFVFAMMLLVATGCSRSASVPEAIDVLEVKTGYDDGGRESGQNRLLPTIAFKVRNKASRGIHSVQFNAVFRVIGDPEELGAQLIQGIDYQGLAPGRPSVPSRCGPCSVTPASRRASRCSSTPGSRMCRSQLFAKQGGDQWVKLSELVVERQLLAIAPAPAAGK